MPMEEEPIVGAVYEDTEGRTFEVVGFDEDEGTVKLTYEDGASEEIDIDAWYEMDLEMIEVDEDEDDDTDEEYEDEDDDDFDEDEDLDEEEDS